MTGKSNLFTLKSVLFACVVGVAALTPHSAAAQSSGDGGTGYQVSDSSDTNSETPPSASGAANGVGTGTESSGPVRLARFSAVRGNVTWRADDSMSWSQATNNMPLRQGGQIWVTEGGRAEVQFDDGSVLRLGNGALATLNVLYSDSEGEFTQITLRDGLATMKARNAHSIYQIDTPLVSLKTTGPSRVRVGVSNGVELAIQQGEATLEGAQGKQHLNTGDYVDLRDAESPYQMSILPAPDNWDRWNDRQDRSLEGDSESSRYLPSNIALVAGDLDTYGTWHDDAHYGRVWCPQVTDSDWRPYHEGHWTWVNPFGWTWVSSEPWGWAPYHYGSWIHQPYGWAWAPGPAQQYWCPAVVHFCETEDRVAWAPLAPSEVRYPSAISLGFHAGNWSLFFSIGQAAVYYPSASYWAARPYNTVEVNHITYINHVTNITNVNNIQNASSYNRYLQSAESYAANNRGNYSNRNPMPINASQFAGASSVSLHEFGGNGMYRTVPLSQASLFSRGRTMAAPSSGRAPLAGPIAVRPTLAALTPMRTLTGAVSPPRSILNRAAFHAPLSGAMRRTATVPSRNGRFTENGNGGQQATRVERIGSTINRSNLPTARVQRESSFQNAARNTTPQRVNSARAEVGNRMREASRPAIQRENLPIVSRRTSGRTAQEAAIQARASLGMTTERGIARQRNSANGERYTPSLSRGRDRYTPRPPADRSDPTIPARARPTLRGQSNPESYRQASPSYRQASPSYRDRSIERPYSGGTRVESRPMRTVDRSQPQIGRERSEPAGRSQAPTRSPEKSSESSSGSHKNSARP